VPESAPKASKAKTDAGEGGDDKEPPKKRARLTDAEKKKRDEVRVLTVDWWQR
jgi:hypothetical protein